MDAGRKLRRLSIEPAMALADDFTADVVRAAREAEGVDGAPPLNDEQLLALEHPRSLPSDADVTHFPVQEAIGMVENPGDASPYLNRLVGYGQLIERAIHPDPTGSLFIHPDHRRQGLGRALVARMHESTAGNVHLWAPGDSVAAQRLARAAHMVPVRELLVMSRSLTDPLPEVQPPPGLKLRHFVISRDQPGFLEVNHRAFAHHPEQGDLKAAELKAKIAEPWFDRNGFFLAVDPDVQQPVQRADQQAVQQAVQQPETGGPDSAAPPGLTKDGRILGFHWTKVHDQHVGEVYVIGVDPDAEGHGLAKALLARGLRHLRDVGCREVILYVEGDHDRAIGLYERNGFSVAKRDVLYAQHLRVPAGPNA